MLKRLPTIWLIHGYTLQLENVRQALFVGYGSLIGVSAIFYLYKRVDFLREMTVNGVQREGFWTACRDVTGCCMGLSDL